MAHKKAGGSKARQGGNVAGKSRGIKVYGGQLVKAGAVLIRQLGTVIRPGKNVYVGRDFTVHAKVAGLVEYSHYKKGKKQVSVIPSNDNRLAFGRPAAP